MPTAGEEKVATESMNVVDGRLEGLKALFPEVFSEGRIDFDKLRTALGDTVDDGPERYSFSWAGKRDSIRLLQKPSRSTLVAHREASVDFDTSGHLFIEGENLEVLKLLYKPYFGRVKMIYIDPPYNTGKDFIFPDNFADPLDYYLRFSGQKDSEGNLLTSNVERGGRFHSSWLSSLYPRLFLARQLLTDDGVIFISMDDNEVHNLRLILNELFGEENFLAQLVWEKTRKNDAKLFSVGHEYMIGYARSLATLKELNTVWREAKPGAKEIMDKCRSLFAREKASASTVQTALREWYQSLPQTHPSKKLSRYKHIDKYSQKYGPWRDRDISWPGGGGPRYDVIHPVTKRPCRVPEAGWRFTHSETMEKQIRMGLVEFRDDDTEPPFRKAHLIPIPEELDDEEVEFVADEEEADDEPVGMQVMPSVIYKQSQVAVKYLRNLMGAKIFDNPKDHEVLTRIIRYCTSPSANDIILDFYGGSASTAEAVLQLNHEEESNRRFICVQLPEPTRKTKKNGKPQETPASKAGYDTIADISRERIRRVIARMKDETNGRLEVSSRPTPEDLGFKAFKLTSSHFRQWESPAPETDADEYIRQMEMLNDPLLEGWTTEQVIYEVAIKEGYSLTSRIERVQEVTGAEVWRVTDEDKEQHFHICLDNVVDLDALSTLGLAKDDIFICRGIALGDTAAANLALQCRLKTL